MNSSDVKITPNENYLKKFIKGNSLENQRETAFNNVFRFKSASYLEVKVGDFSMKGINENIFWEIKYNKSVERFDIVQAQLYADKYYKLLSDSVRIRLRSDVKLGSALSGGLDSSTIVYLINQHLNKSVSKQETFSTVYKSENVSYCDESKYIDQISSHLNVKSNQVEPEVKNVKDSYYNMIYAMENPPPSSQMSGWFTFMMVGNTDVVVTLDGQGADEQLAGYIGYVRNYFCYLPFGMIWNEYLCFRQLPGVKMLNIYAGIIFNLFTKIFPKKWFIKILNKVYGTASFEELNKYLAKSTTAGILTELLHYSDRLSMAHSIESRVPFMDYRLVEFLASVPACYKMHHGWTKYIARLAMDKKLPDEITWRKEKMGWPQPDEVWFQGELNSWALEIIGKSVFLKNIFGNKIKKILLNGRTNDILKLLNIAIWYDVFFQDS